MKNISIVTISNICETIFLYCIYVCLFVVYRNKSLIYAIICARKTILHILVNFAYVINIKIVFTSVLYALM